MVKSFQQTEFRQNKLARFAIRRYVRIDGDTVVLDGGERVRLIGVDTPRCSSQYDPMAEWTL